MEEVTIDEPKKYSLCEVFNDAGALLVSISLPTKADRTSIRIDKFTYNLFKGLRLYVRRRFKVRSYTKLATFVVFYGLRRIKSIMSEAGVRNIGDVNISLSSVLFNVIKFPKLYSQTDVINIYSLHELNEIVDDIDFVFHNKVVMYSVAINEFFYDLLKCDILKLSDEDIDKINKIHNDVISIIRVFSSVSKGGEI